MMKPKIIEIGEEQVKFGKVLTKPVFREISIKYPSRLDAACTDPGKLYSISPKDNIYPTGQIIFCADICKTITVRAREDSKNIIEGNYGRKNLIKHAAILMQKAFGLENGFDIKIDTDLDLRHCGVGSSASAIQGVGAAINELYGCPMRPMDIIRYLAGNHAEEIDGDDSHLVAVQSVGGSGVCGHFDGGFTIITGRSIPIFQYNLPSDLKIVFGVPKEYSHPDANSLIRKEIKYAEDFEEVSKKYSNEIAYRLLNNAMPEMAEGNFTPMKELIFDYRWDMGSIKNCSYAYPNITELAEEMRPLRDDPDIKFIFLSTAGPGFCIVTEKPDKATKIFDNLNMRSFIANIHNGKYKILNKVK